MTRLPLPVLLAAQGRRVGVILSVPLNWDDMWAVQWGQVSQCWTLSLGDRHSRRCYLFKFRLFLCLFSGLSVGWKVFPLSHCSVLFRQPRTMRALLKDLRNTMVLSAPPASPSLEKQPYFYNWTYSDKMHFVLHYTYNMLAQFPVGPEFFFLSFSQLRKSSHIYKQWETHITRIFWTRSSILSCPISYSSVKVEHAALQVAHSFIGCFTCVCILKPFMLSWDIKEGFICLTVAQTIVCGQLQANIDPMHMVSSSLASTLKGK